MKANPRARFAGPLLAGPLLAAALVAACVSAPRPPPPPMALAPPPIAPPSKPATPAGWQDAPITTGVWRWSEEDGQSVARFGDDLLVLRCDRARGVVELLRAGGSAETGSIPMSIDTTALTRPVSGAPVARTRPAIVLRLAAGDPLLDAMAFSRGRLAVEVAGMPTLIVPSWPEVARVIEDCR